MVTKVVPLNSEHVAKLVAGTPLEDLKEALKESYFSKGSVSYCLLANGEPVFAGGIINMGFRGGEAWMLPTAFFHSHLKICYRVLRSMIPHAAMLCGQKREQANSTVTTSTILFEHLGFKPEGVLKHFGPNGESCHLYARFFGQVN
jgi:hypothetical protein